MTTTAHDKIMQGPNGHLLTPCGTNYATSPTKTKLTEGEIDGMQDGESLVVNLGESSGAEIWKKHDCLFLFEIPQFGGRPLFSASFRSSEPMSVILEIEKWT